MNRVFLMSIIVFKLIFSLTSRFTTVAIITSNDIHGNALPTTLYTPNTNESYQYGGLYYMASMIQRLEEEYKGSVLYVDSGDQFEGALQSSPIISNGTMINDFFNIIKVNTSAIGNHEFDFGPDFLKRFMKDRRQDSQFLSANLISKTQGDDFLPNQHSSRIVELECGIKIGLIGLTTLKTEETFKTYEDTFPYPDYVFEAYVPIIINESTRLRQAGVHAVVLNCHVGKRCTSNEKYGIWEESTKQNGQCMDNDEMSQVINALPQGTVDAVAQGHRHKFSHHFIKGIPIAGTINGGYYFNVIYLKFYNKKIYHKSIEGPIPVCHKVFKNRKTCNYLSQEQAKTAGELVPMKFHGKIVQPHKKLKRLFNKWSIMMKPYLNELAYNQVILNPIVTGQNDLSILITSLMSNAVPQADFAIISPSVFRTTWYPGKITQDDLFSMFPLTFDLISFDITGKEIVDILKAVQLVKTHHFYAIKGLRETIKRYTNGTLEYGNVTWTNGTEIDPQKTYKGVASGILMKGDEDFLNPIKGIYTLRNQKSFGMFRDVLKAELLALKRIKKGTLYDPKNPHLTIVQIR